MRLLLTGGAGFIGSCLAERLIERGETVTIVDNFNDFYDPRIKRRNLEQVRQKGEVTLFETDILDRPALEQVFAQARPEVVVHLAAWAGVRPSIERPWLYSSVNITGTTHLLELSRDRGVCHFVFGSSSSVYGINSRVPFHEDDPVCEPISPYAVTKRAGELLSLVYCRTWGLPVTCLRFFTVYGPRQRPEMAVHKFTRMIDREEEIQVYHEGRSERDYTWIDDILQGVLAALDEPRGFRLYNLGNSRTVVLTDLISEIERALGRKARLRLMPPQPGDVPITLADIRRARRQLGYEPEVSIEEGISRFVQWYKRYSLIV